MKSFYYLLLHFSLNDAVYLSSNKAILDSLNHEINRHGVMKQCQDIPVLVDFLFKKLSRRFNQFFCDLNDISTSEALENSGRVTDLWATFEELTLLLRSCMVILTLITFDQNLLVEKVQVLLSILGGLVSLVSSEEYEDNSICLRKSFSHECTITDSGSTTFVSEDLVASIRFLEPSNSCHPLLCAVLEVFADELLIHRPLREYFMLVDSASSSGQMLFIRDLVHGDMGSVLEVISAHFILSISNEQSYQNFLTRLFWGQSRDFRVPELSPSSAISLLLNPVMLSAPKMLQAHYILLVSEAIGVCFLAKDMIPLPKFMDCYLTAFEMSVKLYTRHMSYLHRDSDCKNSSSSFFNSNMLGNNFQPSFESYIQQTRRMKIDNSVSKSDKFWTSYLFLNLKSDLLVLSIAYLEETQHVLDKSCKQDMLSILRCIILGAFSGNFSDTGIYKNGDTSPHDIYLLASVLKLMSCSLFPAIWCIRHGGNNGGLRTLKDVSSCKEYDFISSIISRFREFETWLPNQLFISEVMSTHPERHMDSKWMLLHFAGLLSLSFVSGIPFLVKGCIFALMMLLNLYVFEEGDLAALLPLHSSGLEALSSKPSSDKVDENMVHKRSSKKVASQFQKTLRSSTDSLRCLEQIMQEEPAETSKHVFICDTTKESTFGMEEETCSGEIFLNCLLERPSSSHDDIADFIECKRGKNYGSWLKNRQSYRKWRSKKLAVLSWNKRKKTWKFIKGKKT